MPEERRELIFTEGWTTKALPSHGKRGLGLALVRRLAERRGGSATVAGGPEGGAEFTVVLPDALSDAPDGLPSVPEPTAPEPTGPESIVLGPTAPEPTAPEPAEEAR